MSRGKYGCERRLKSAARGGSWNLNPARSSSSTRLTDVPSIGLGSIGFRLAGPVAVPQPSTTAMALAGLACGGYSLFRRRRARHPRCKGNARGIS